MKKSFNYLSKISVVISATMLTAGALKAAPLHPLSEAGKLAGTERKALVTREVIEWISMEKALELCKTNPRKIYIDFYTDWCGWCKKMDRDSFTDQKVVREMNAHFYAVKFNAEGREKLTVNGQVYSYSPDQHINSFTLAMLDGQIGYPTSVIMGEKGEKITSVPGYQEAPMLVEILSYFGNNKHLTESFETFQKSGK